MDLPPSIQGPIITAIAAIFGAFLGSLTALSVNLLNLRQTVLERKRHACADAIADALSWMELPYRVRRRSDDNAETVKGLVDRMHHLQERLVFHENWLRIDLPGAHERYCNLIQEVRLATRQKLQESWEQPPTTSPGGMNIGDLGLPSVEQSITAFSDEVRRRLVWWRFFD